MTGVAGTEQEREQPGDVRSARLGMLLGIAVSGSLFTALTGTILVLRSSAGPGWGFPDPVLQTILAWVSVVVLGIGSFMLEVAQAALRRGDYFGLRATLLNSSAKGVAFVLLTLISWSLLMTPRVEGGSGATFLALYSTLSGLQLCHVVWALVLVVPLALGRQTPSAARLSNAALLWHYVTALGAVLLVLFHVLGGAS